MAASSINQLIGTTPTPLEPSLHVAETNEEVGTDTLVGNLTTGNVRVDEVTGSDMDIFTEVVELVGAGHVLVETSRAM